MCMPATMINHCGAMEILANEFGESSPMDVLKNLEETMRGLGAECALAFTDGEDAAKVARTFAKCSKAVAAHIAAIVREGR